MDDRDTFALSSTKTAIFMDGAGGSCIKEEKP